MLSSHPVGSANRFDWDQARVPQPLFPAMRKAGIGITLDITSLHRGHVTREMFTLAYHRQTLSPDRATAPEFA